MEDSERKKVTRRGFLKLAAAAIAGVGLAYVGAPPKTAEAPGGVAADPEVKPKGEARVFSEGGVKVWEGQDGVPQRWADSKGNSGIFDKDELLKAKETANKESRFVVAAARVVNMTAGNEPVPTVTRAETTNLPEDIVSHEQLGQRGIELISGEKIGVYFRQSAFSEGGVLADYTEGGDRKLVIIVADNPTLTPFAFDDARYDKYREILMGRLAEPKPQTAGGIREMMAANFSNSVLPNGEFLGRVWEGMPDREIIEEGLYPGTDGYYVPNGFEGGLPDKSVLMVALGGRPEKSYDVVRVDVGPAGEFSYFLEKVGSKDLGIYPKDGLEQNQSYPDPKSFELTEEYKTRGPGKLWGVYETRPPGFKFRHELAHDYKLHHKTGESVYDWSESETDILAAGKLTEARKKMDETGDDSGYCVVLEDRERKFVVVT